MQHKYYIVLGVNVGLFDLKEVRRILDDELRVVLSSSVQAFGMKVLELIHSEEVHGEASQLSGLNSALCFPNVTIQHVDESLKRDVGDTRRVGDLSQGRVQNSCNGGVELQNGGLMSASHGE